MKTYLVGGAVRDRLLGQTVSEKDWVVVGATEGEMLALGFREVGKGFPVFLHPETNEECVRSVIDKLQRGTLICRYATTSLEPKRNFYDMLKLIKEYQKLLRLPENHFGDGALKVTVNA